MVNLSLCMIVRNEAERLAACLESVQGLVDEMIIVDTGSSDATIAIAEAQGATVHSFPWNDDFAEARNAALALAQGEWVLVLDADEILLPGVLQALAPYRFMADVLAISLRRQEIGAQQAPYSQVLRLFRQHPALHFSRPYHEGIDDAILALQAEAPHWRVITLSDIAIAHDGYQAAQLVHKTERAQRIMQRHLAAHPGDLYIANKLGALLVNTGDLSGGRALLSQCLEASDDLVRYEALYHLGLAASQAGDAAQSIDYYQRAIALDLEAIFKLSAYFNLAVVLEKQGDLEQSLALYEKVQTIQPDFAPVYVSLGLRQKAQGQFTDAIAYYLEAIDIDPDYAPAHQNLAVVLFKVGQSEASQAAFDRAIAIYDLTAPEQAAQLRKGVQSLFAVI